MKITLELHGETYIVEGEPSKADDYDAGKLIETFSRMLVLAGFYPDVIVPQDGGRYNTTHEGEYND